MLCAVCREREAVYNSFRVPRDTAAEERGRCLRCWEREEAVAVPEDERRIREMAVEWDMIRPLLTRAESRGHAYELRRLADVLQDGVERWGRTKPPDVAAFLKRHR